MPRDFVKYGYDSDGFVSEFGDIKQPSKRDRSRLFTMLDQLEDWFGHGIYEKRIEQTEYGQVKVTIEFDGDAWVDREERADRLERMLQWLVLKLSAEELRYLGIVPRTADPAAFTAEQLLAGLTEQFDQFAKADDRLRGKRRP
jgi:hypothetical protein